MPVFHGRVSAEHGDFAELRGLVVVVSVDGKDQGRYEVGPDGVFEAAWDDPRSTWRVQQGDLPVLPPRAVPAEGELGPGTVLLPLAPSAPRLDAAVAQPYLPPDSTKAVAGMLRHAVGKGWLSASQAARADRLLEDLHAFMGAAEAAALRLPGAWERFASLLAPEAPTLPEAFKPVPGNPLDFGGCRVTLRSAFAPVQAALAHAPGMLGQAVTGYVRRAEAFERLAQAAALDLGPETEPWLRQVVEHAVELGGPTGAGLPLQRLLAREIGERDALRAAELGSTLAHVRIGGFGGVGPLPGPKFGPGVPPIGFGRLDLCQLRWMECVDALTRPPGPPPPSPPEVDRVEPTAFCLGSGGTVTLWPGPGGFPAQPDPAVRLVVGIPGAVVRWSATRIDIDVPSGTPAGCWPLEWEVLTDATLLEGPQAACAAFFSGGAALRPWPAVTRRDIAHVLVAGPPFARLSSGGRDRFVEAAGCTPVTVSWTVGSGFENTACRAKVDFEVRLDSGQGWTPVALDDTTRRAGGDGSHGGVVTVQSAQDMTLRLEVVLRVGGQACQSAQASFEVRRFQQLELEVAPLVQEGSFPVRVRRSCPAPAGGVAFVIDSDAPAVVQPASGMLPAGASEALVPMTALRCASARLTVSAPGHRGSTRPVTVRGLPELAGLQPAAWTACTNVRLVVQTRCAGPNPVLDLRSAGGVTTVALQPSGGRAPADPWGDVTYTGVAQGLLAGSYTPVLRSAEGRASAPGPAITVAPQPVSLSATVSATNPAIAPGSNLGAVPVCIGADVTVEVSVTGATDIVVRARNSMQVTTRRRGLQCGTWTERFSGPFFRPETFEITATGPGGSATLTRSLSAMQVHPFSVGAVRVVNRSSTSVFAALVLVDPQTGQNLPLELGSVPARSAKLFDDFIDDKKIPDCTPVIAWVLRGPQFLPVQSNFSGVVAYTPAPSATLYRTFDGGNTLEFDIDDAAVQGSPP